MAFFERTLGGNNISECRNEEIENQQLEGSIASVLTISFHLLADSKIRKLRAPAYRSSLRSREESWTARELFRQLHSNPGRLIFQRLEPYLSILTLLATCGFPLSRWQPRILRCQGPWS